MGFVSLAILASPRPSFSIALATEAAYANTRAIADRLEVSARTVYSATGQAGSIIIIGALLQVSSGQTWIMWLAGITILITSINIFGGFAVTRRMLEMFRK